MSSFEYGEGPVDKRMSEPLKIAGKNCASDFYVSEKLKIPKHIRRIFDAEEKTIPTKKYIPLAAQTTTTITKFIYFKCLRKLNRTHKNKFKSLTYGEVKFVWDVIKSEVKPRVNRELQAKRKDETNKEIRDSTQRITSWATALKALNKENDTHSKSLKTSSTQRITSWATALKALNEKNETHRKTSNSPPIHEYAEVPIDDRIKEPLKIASKNCASKLYESEKFESVHIISALNAKEKPISASKYTLITEKIIMHITNLTYFKCLQNINSRHKNKFQSLARQEVKFLWDTIKAEITSRVNHDLQAKKMPETDKELSDSARRIQSWLIHLNSINKEDEKRHNILLDRKGDLNTPGSGESPPPSNKGSKSKYGG